jgi:hypothetical protein
MLLRQIKGSNPCPARFRGNFSEIRASGLPSAHFAGAVPAGACYLHARFMATSAAPAKEIFHRGAVVSLYG